MAKYVTKQRKQMACELAGFRGALLHYLNSAPEEIAGFETRIKTMRTYCQSLIDSLLYDLDEDHYDFVDRQMRNIELVLEPTAKARSMPILTILNTKDVLELCRTAQWQCIGCEHDKIAQKKCELRGMFLRCGAAAYDNGKGVCPFKKGL